MAKGKPRSIVVVEERGERFVVAAYPDGSVVKKRVDPNERPSRKPRKPIARARTESLNKTKRKQICPYPPASFSRHFSWGRDGSCRSFRFTRPPAEYLVA